MIAFMVTIALVTILVVWAIKTYNSLIDLRNRIEGAWSQVDVLLNRRADLIPNLVETVKGYATHERQVFDEVTTARSAISQPGTVRQRAEAESMITSALKSLFAVAEAYPNLKANQNFLQMQADLNSTEDRIAYARQFYNDIVRVFNTRIETFPVTIIASMFNFVVREYYPVDQAARQPVRVSFNSEVNQ